MKKLDFTVPFSGFASTTFINCFTSVYLHLEGLAPDKAGATHCSQWETGRCGMRPRHDNETGLSG